MAKKDFEEVLKDLKKKMTVFFEPEVIKTDILPLDLVLNGGLETGSLIELSGESQTGKSTLLLHMAKNLCDKGINVMYIDAEGSVKDDLLNGVGLMKYKCTPTHPDNKFFVLKESGYQAVESAIKEILPTEKFKVFIIDSVTAFSLDVYLDLDNNRLGTEDRVGADALALGKLLKQLNALKTTYNVVFIYINQTRIDMSGWQPTYKASGGQAAKYYPDIKLFMKLVEKLKKKENVALLGEIEKPYGANTTITAQKSRLGAGFIPYPLQIQFGRGCSNLTAYMEFLPNMKNKDGIPLLEKKSSVSYAIHLPSGDKTTSKGANGLMELVYNNYDEITEVVSEYLKQYWSDLRNNSVKLDDTDEMSEVTAVKVKVNEETGEVEEVN